MINGLLDVKTWSAELQTKQQILLAVIRLAGILKINFAFPSSSIYVEKGNSEIAEKRHNSIEELMEDFEKQFKLL